MCVQSRVTMNLTQLCTALPPPVPSVKGLCYLEQYKCTDQKSYKQEHLVHSILEQTYMMHTMLPVIQLHYWIYMRKHLQQLKAMKSINLQLNQYKIALQVLRTRENIWQETDS